VVNLTVDAATNATPAADEATVDATEDTTASITLTGDDGDGDELTFNVVGQPQHGTLTGAAPELEYTPAPDFYGVDTLTFTTSDGQATSPPATVTIDVAEVNDPPIAGADALIATSDDVLALDATTLVANDTPGPANEASQTLAVTGVVPDAAGATHGTVTLTDGTITYTPEPGFTGPATFTYTVCDNGTTAAARTRDARRRAR
jgi:hypothetical protein